MKKLSVFMLIIAIVCIVTSSYAADYDFSGNFTKDNDVLLFNFSVTAPSSVTVFSSSWLSETGGGFDPMLGIWTSSGTLINFQDDGHNIGTTMSNGVPYNHGTWDSYYSVNLAAGNYIASVTQFDNFNNGSNLSDGFQYDGNPNFTFDLGYGGATQPYFNGIWDSNDPRTSYWQFHLLNVASASVNVPEPATMLLFGLGLIGLAGVRRMRS